MRYVLIILISLCFLSCGPFQLAKLNKKLITKGYNPYRDTVAINPHESLIIHKDYWPQLRECPYENELNVKISIKGFENAEYIPLNRLKDTLEIILNDPSINKIESGRLELNLHSFGQTIFLWTDSISNNCKRMFGKKFINRIKKVSPYCVLFFSCVKVKKNGIIYDIPNRKYLLE